MTDRTRYAVEATSWALDSRRRDARSVRIAWAVATVAAGIAALETVALVLLMPLKTVQSITLLVDRQTGFVQALDPQTPHRVRADAALTNALLFQYVSAREAFDRATIGNDFRRVVLWSADKARMSYLASMSASNSDSPLQRYPAGTIVGTHVKSISPMGAGTALVRFDTRQEGAGRQASARPWIAMIRYRYSDAEMPFESRLINPLGFQVVSYRRDAEAPAPAPMDQPERAADPPPRQPETPSTYHAASEPRYRRLSPQPPLAPVSRGLALNQIPQGSPLDPFGVAAAAPVVK